MSDQNDFSHFFSLLPALYFLVVIYNKVNTMKLKEKLSNRKARIKHAHRRFQHYLKRAVRITYSITKQEQYVWKELKNLQRRAEWHHGVYETEKYIETKFEISENNLVNYCYSVYDGFYHCRVNINEDYPVGLTTQIFILATHLNNLLTTGVVIVNAQKGVIEYYLKTEILIPNLYPGEVQALIIKHFNISKDIYWAFNQLIFHDEEPALIIADLLKTRNEEGTQKS